MSNLEAGVRELVEELLGEAPADALAPLQLSEDAREELRIELEERFGVQLAAEDTQSLRSISAITAFVQKSQARVR